MEERLAAEAGSAPRPPPLDGAAPGPNDPRRLAVRAGSFVTPEIVSMFEGVAGGAPHAAESAVARRAWELLKRWDDRAFLRELAELARHARVKDVARGGDGDVGECCYWEFLLAHYHSVRLRMQNLVHACCYWELLLADYHSVRRRVQNLVHACCCYWDFCWPTTTRCARASRI